LIDEPQDKAEQQDDVAEGQDAQAAGPDAASEGPAGGGGASVLGPSESAPPAEEASEAQDGAPMAEGDAAEESEAEELEVEVPAAEGDATEELEPKVEAPAAEEKKKDVIPGADLEPIAVEPEERPLSAEEQARVEAEEEERAKREAELTGEAEEEEPTPASRAPQKMEGDARFLATGKRKTSIARVTLLAGSGKIEINKRPLEDFFPRPLHQTMARQPLTITGYEGSVDVRVRVHGGGISGQAGAVRHGIARALTAVDPELRGELKRRGFLTRDARAKERRKAGLKKARKRPQFSKR
jgi:small subunit ribosomal protein S9